MEMGIYNDPRALFLVGLALVMIGAWTSVPLAGVGAVVLYLAGVIDDAQKMEKRIKDLEKTVMKLESTRRTGLRAR